MAEVLESIKRGYFATESRGWMGSPINRSHRLPKTMAMNSNINTVPVTVTVTTVRHGVLLVSRLDGDPQIEMPRGDLTSTLSSKRLRHIHHLRCSGGDLYK
jgi:hypothetical protein